jgi:hypothetical protein
MVLADDFFLLFDLFRAAISFVAVEGKVCMRARPTFCTMVNWQANVSAVAAAGKAELDLAVEVSGQPASE